jgi:hypothetical protein
VHVSLSRGRYDAQIYTNDAEKLGEDLSRDVLEKPRGRAALTVPLGKRFAVRSIAA